MQKYPAKKFPAPLLSSLIPKIAEKIGATVHIDPWNIVGQITFKNGKKQYFKYSSLDINPQAAAEIAKDKDFSHYYIKQLGYPIVPKSKTFFSDHWASVVFQPNRRIDNGYEYAQSIGFPVVVKPNSFHQGIGVAIVHTKEEFYRAVHEIFKDDRIFIVQSPVQGKDYRIVVFDSDTISAYERLPLNVIGDGASSIEQLLILKEAELAKKGRQMEVAHDPRITEKLAHQNLSFKSIPQKNDQIFLLDNANLSTGGDSIDITDSIHPSFAQIAINLTKDMGLRLCGVDIMVDGDITKPADSQKYWVLEINASPGLDHYRKLGSKQEKIVEDLYLKILLDLEK